MSSKLVIGSTVYDEHGFEYELLAMVCSDWCVCRPIEDVCDEDNIYLDPVVLPRAKIHDTPPIARRQEQCQELDDQLKSSRNELSQLRAEISRVEKENADKIAKLSARSSALSRIGDFLDGKITHYVISDYFVFHIVLVEDTVPDEYGFSGKMALKLLTLFGAANGSLEWRLNTYSDGSGKDIVCYPCCSEEEARVAARMLINTKVADWRAGNLDVRSLQGFQASAVKLGLEFPKDASQAIIERRHSDLEAVVAKKLEDYEKSKKELVEIDWIGDGL